ncbi:MAG: DMT family transporter [Bacteroidota bacterium]|nr:DMT family transporter [Bacteroidota bacterium]
MKTSIQNKKQKFIINTSFLEKRHWQYIMLFFLALIWGSSFILMKKGLRSFSPYQVAAFRIFLTFLFFLPFTFRILHKLNRKNIGFLIIIGFVGNALPAFMYTIGQTEVNSSLAGILNSLVPLFTMIVGVTIYKTSTGWVNVLGVFSGLTGAIGLIYYGSEMFMHGNIWYSIFIIVAVLGYAISSNVNKENLSELNGFAVTALSFFLIGPWAGIYLLFSNLEINFTTEGAILDFTFVAILSFFSSFIAVTLLYTLMKYTTTIFATSVTYIIPVFAIIWGLIDGEQILPAQFIWIFIILLGIYLVNYKKKKN